MKTEVNRCTFKILFYIVRLKKNKIGDVPVYCRLTVNGKIKEFSTQLWIKQEQWDADAGKVKGTKELAKTINNTIDGIQFKLQNIRSNLTLQGKEISAESVINIYSGKGEKKHFLLDLHTYYNEQYLKPLIGKDYAKGTYDRYRTSISHLKTTLKLNTVYGDSDEQDHLIPGQTDQGIPGQTDHRKLVANAVEETIF